MCELDVGGLTALRMLLVGSNRLAALPSGLHASPRLESLFLAHNPLAAPAAAEAALLAPLPALAELDLSLGESRGALVAALLQRLVRDERLDRAALRTQRHQADAAISARGVGVGLARMCGRRRGMEDRCSPSLQSCLWSV